MLLPSFFVMDFRDYDDLPDIEFPENGFACFTITSETMVELSSFYRKLFLRPKKYSFCLMVNVKNKLDQPEAELMKLADFIVSCSFHSQYIKTSQDNPLVLLEVNDADTKKYESAISEAFKDQGYNEVNMIPIYGSSMLPPRQGESKQIRFDIQSNRGSFSLNYMECIRNLNSCDLFFLFFLNDAKKLHHILRIIQQAESTLMKDMAQVYHLVKESSTKTTEKQELLFEIELLQEKIESAANYHLYYDSTDSRYKKQIAELLRFYNNEYEILPLWYKRFGHIVKVLMGKRTFRSLFKDNVKKYKA